MDIKKQNDPKAKKQIKAYSPVNHNLWIGGFALIALACLAAHFLLKLGFFEVLGKNLEFLKKLALGGFFAFVVLIVTRIIERIVGRRSHGLSTQYNLVRAIRLLSILLFIGVLISFVFENWYTAIVSLGLISLILGFALQTPISSFIGWLYIIFRTPYHVGDRIQIQDFTGDVVEIGYVDTTLWEFGGAYLTSDMPSGRLIRFPNSLVFQYAVYNYSWKKFPFIWNEIPFHVAYESDFDYVESVLKKITKAELGPGMDEEIEKLKEIVEQTPVDELDIKEYPYVTFRTNANTWVEATVNYLVEPKKAASIRTQIVKKAVAALLKEPGKVMFPNSNAR